MQGLSSQELQKFMDENGLNQIKLAKAARVSQSTVSRALAIAKTYRKGGARQKLFIYALRKSKAKAGVLGKEQVYQAFDRIWNGSDVHAAAIAKIIEALGGLRPPTNSREDQSDE